MSAGATLQSGQQTSVATTVPAGASSSAAVTQEQDSVAASTSTVCVTAQVFCNFVTLT